MSYQRGILIEDDTTFINVMEHYVKACVKKTAEELGACCCQICFANMCALALNSLEPKYVTTKKGELLLDVEAAELKNQTAVLVAATKAVIKVKANPHHEQVLQR